MNDGGAIRIVSGDPTLTGSITLTAGARINSGSTGASIIAGDISGTNTNLTQGGTGTTTLAGTNNYAGGTLVNRRRLTGNTAALQSAIQNNAVLGFALGTNGTFAGALRSAGRVEKTGAGVLTFAPNGPALTGPLGGDACRGHGPVEQWPDRRAGGAERRAGDAGQQHRCDRSDRRCHLQCRQPLPRRGRGRGRGRGPDHGRQHGAAGRQDYAAASVTTGIAAKAALGKLRIDAEAAARFEIGDRAPEAPTPLMTATDWETDCPVSYRSYPAYPPMREQRIRATITGKF